MIYTDEFLKKAIEEVSGPDENNRRAMAKRRHDIYKDGGKEFLIEQISREFSPDSIKEMRLAPINFLKKIVNSLGAVYKRPPERKCQDAKDQALVDYYSQELNVNWLMQKANRYLVLASNTLIYTRPWLNKDGSWCLKSQVTPNYLYSLIPSVMDQTEIYTVIFSAFVDAGRITPQSNLYPATGIQGFSQERGYKTEQDIVDSRERETLESSQQYIFWSDEEHVTTNEAGDRISMSGDEDEFKNPIGRMPIVNLARDRDNEVWATQGEDMVDLAAVLQSGWTDVMTIGKAQGFSQLVITSEEEPKKLVVGLNKALWLKIAPNSPPPNVDFLSPNSPIDQYTEMLDKLTKLLLTTNNIDPGSVGGDAKSQQFTSGFHALISMSDNLEAVQADKPVMAKAEGEFWDIVSKWHNWMYENGILCEEARALGQFSDDFEVQIIYPDIRPLESEDEKINRVKLLTDLGLITKRQSLKKLNPDASDEQIDQMLEELQNEKAENVAKAQEIMGGMNAAKKGQVDESLQGESEDGDESGQDKEASPGDSL